MAHQIDCKYAARPHASVCHLYSTHHLLPLEERRVERSLKRVFIEKVQVIVGGIWYIVMYPSLFLPFSLIAASSGCVVMVVFLIIDLRQLHQERQEGLPTAWQKSPKLLRHLKDMAFYLGCGFLIGGNAYVRFHSFPTRFFPENLAIGIVPLLLLLLTAVLHFAANYFEVEQQPHSEEQRAAYSRHMQHLCRVLAARADMLLYNGHQSQEE